MDARKRLKPGVAGERYKLICTVDGLKIHSRQQASCLGYCISTGSGVAKCGPANVPTRVKLCVHDSRSLGTLI